MPTRDRTLIVVTIMAACAALTACAPRSPQVVGGQTMDQAQYNRDLAACQQQAASSFSFGNAVTDCMRAHGYKVM